MRCARPMYRFMRLELRAFRGAGQIAEQTGGRHFAFENLAELPDVAAKIGIELRNEYVRGCSPKNTARHGKYRRVIVRLVKTAGLPPLRAMFGTGYYAPTQ